MSLLSMRALASRLKNSADFESFSGREDARRNLMRNSLRGFSYVLLSGGGEFALRLGSTAILARLISPESFGLFMMVTAVTAVADQFRDLGLSTATIQRERITHHEVSNLFWINTAAGCLIALTVCVLSPFVSSYFHEPRLTSMTIALASTFVLGGLSVQHEALLGRQMRLGPKSGMRLVAFLFSSVVGVLMALAGYGYWALVWREISRSAFIVVGAWALCPWIPGRPRRDTEVWSLLNFGSGLTATYILGALTGSLDRLLLGRFHGADAVGLYRQSYQLVITPMSQLMGPLYQVSLPGLSMLQDDSDRFRDFYTRIVSIVAIVSMPLGVFLLVYAEEVSAVVLGDQWHGAATFIRIFGVGGMFQSVFSTIGFVLVSTGRSRELFMLGIAYSTIKSLLMLFGLSWGPVGVATADVAATLAMFSPFLYVTVRNSPITIIAFLRALSRPFTSSVLLIIVLMGFRSTFSLAPAFLSLIAGVSVTAIVFPLIWLVLPGGRFEFRTLRSAVSVALARSS